MSRALQEAAVAQYETPSQNFALGLRKTTKKKLFNIASICVKDSCIILTLTLLTWTIWRAPTNASKWRMEFNSAFKGLTQKIHKVRNTGRCTTNDNRGKERDEQRQRERERGWEGRRKDSGCWEDLLLP